MTSMLEYNGYIGSAAYSDPDEVFHGRLEFIRDLRRRDVKEPMQFHLIASSRCKSALHSPGILGSNRGCIAPSLWGL
ncbi:putative HicB family RNase H-like nuclease [Constrictibacter sp. MBR-5]|jgi:predicted HicB family RNase H-like nuclease|uniref:hypothetical protein n=1 Tax=Constrictibacter sp. MBR-5 TaxID=3156467 RepID=UPI0033961647